MPPSQLTVPDNLILTSNSTNLLALKGTATPPAAVIYAPSTAVADADLSANTLAPSIDETNHALRVRVEYANGTTLKTALVPFQPASTITVGASGADFTSIQAAWNYLKGRLLQGSITIAVQSGTYASDSTNFAYACVAAYVSANGAVATQNVTGFLVQDCGTLYAAGGGTSHNSFTGVQALNNAVAYVDGCTARDNLTGYVASWNALTIATNTNANNSGNSFNYNPATSGTPGNFDALTNWS